MKPVSSTQAIVSVVMVLLLISGCSAFVNVSPREMSIEDIIKMTNAGIGTDVIESQITATHSHFRLDSDQIVLLKEKGVDEKVIAAMIESGEAPEYFDWEYGYSPYEYWFNYYNSWYPVYNYNPYVYPHSPYSIYPYTVYRQRDYIGRFYRYVPRPLWDYRSRQWIYPGQPNTDEKKDEE